MDVGVGSVHEIDAGIGIRAPPVPENQRREGGEATQGEVWRGRDAKTYRKSNVLALGLWELFYGSVPGLYRTSPDLADTLHVLFDELAGKRCPKPGGAFTIS